MILQVIKFNILNIFNILYFARIANLMLIIIQDFLINLKQCENCKYFNKF
jgi:hypothetical protein